MIDSKSVCGSIIHTTIGWQSGNCSLYCTAPFCSMFKSHLDDKGHPNSIYGIYRFNVGHRKNGPHVLNLIIMNLILR